MMRLLLDTHALLWTFDNTKQLHGPALDAIRDQRNDVFVSAVSVWEIAIKRALGKLAAPADFEAGVSRQGFSALPITFRHAQSAGSLPRHHADPFDRMLIAQAQCESLTLVTRDAYMDLYAVETLPA